MVAARLIRSLALVLLSGACVTAQGASLLFSSNDQANVGRVEISVDGPATPADIGATDFTLEFWMRSAPGNSSAEVGCDRAGYNWIEGNIVFDRDRLSGTRDFGLAIAGGLIVFGVETSGSYTICSSSNVLNGQWRHIAVQRRVSDGWLWLYVDGVLERQADGPNGDISYPDTTGSGKEPLLVIGREKYDFGPPGFRGWIDEVRLSNTLRYPSGNFTVPTQPFNSDSSTAALYHFDEGSGETIVDQNGNSSPGVRRFSAAAGPQWSTETPFTAGPGTLQFSAATYSVGEGTATLAMTVTRTGGSSGAATVDVGATGGTATSGADYQFTPTTLTWAAGESGPKTLTLTVIDDADVESNETVALALSNATGAGLGSPASTTATIIDNDVASPGVLQFSTATYSVGEETASLVMTVTRTGGSGGAATVDVGVTGGTATSSADYQFTPATLTWAAGESGPKTLTLAVIDDADIESSETVALALSNATGAGLGSPAATTVTITDNDVASPGVLQFSTATYSVSEGTTTLAMTVRRIGGSAGAATVNTRVTGGTATSGADYQFTPTTLSWAAGESGSKTLTLTLIDDADVESNETVALALSNATGAGLGSPAATTVTITDNDVASPGVLQFSTATYSVSEGTATLAMTVTRTGGSAGMATVNVDLTGGTATPGADYQFTPTTLTWAEGEVGGRPLTITVIDDTVVESAETLSVALSNAAGAGLGSPSTATLTINDNDSTTPPPTQPPPASGGGGAFDPWWLMMGLGGLRFTRRIRRRQ